MTKWLVLLAAILSYALAPPQVENIKLDARRYQEAVLMLAPEGVSHTTNGSTHRYKAKSSYNLEVLAADPRPKGNVEIDGKEMTASQFVKAESERLHASERSKGGVSKVMRAGEFQVNLTYRRDYTGNITLIESTDHPVDYVRIVQAPADKAQWARDQFVSMSFWTGGPRVRMYPDGFPQQWPAAFGAVSLDMPWPQSPQSLPGDTSRGEGASYSFYDYGDVGIVVRQDSHYEPPTIAALRPHPRTADLDPNPARIKIEKADMVYAHNIWMIRQRGTVGQDDYKEEWISYITHTGGRESTLFAKRKPGQPWPKELPFDPGAAGSPVSDDRWIEPDAEKRRSVGDISLITKQGPARQGEITYLARDGQDYMIKVFRGSEALRVKAMFEPPKDGRGLAPICAKYVNPTLDAGSAWKGDDFFCFNRVWGGDGGDPSLDMGIFTMQGGEPYLIQLIYMANPNGVNRLRATLASIQGKDGKPLYPDGLGSYAWYVPGADFRLYVTGIPMYQRSKDRGFLYTPGFTIDKGKTRLGVLVYGPKGDPNRTQIGWHLTHGEARGGSKPGRPREFATDVFGNAATGTESDWGEETLTTLVRRAPHDRAALVISRPKGESDEAWRKLLVKGIKP